MPATKLPLLLAKGWKAVAPRATGRHLLWQSNGRVLNSETDFSQPHVLGEVGPVDCPLAVDTVRRMVYAYVSPLARHRRDYSEIRAWHLDLGTSRRLFSLGLNQWALWHFSHLQRHDAILTLVATDMPGEGVNIQHQLGIFDIAKLRSLLVNLPRDAFLPLDIHPSRRELLFYGVEGYQVIDFAGKRLRRLAGPGLPEGRGGCFHPRREQILLGGTGIVLWDTGHDTLEQLHPRGHYPVWDKSGEGFWFGESSGDLYHYSLDTGHAERIVSLAANPHPELRHARGVVSTADGRYLALCLTRRIKRSSSSDPDKPEYRHDHCLCVLDTQAKEVWQFEGPCRNPVWYEPELTQFGRS